MPSGARAPSAEEGPAGASWPHMRLVDASRRAIGLNQSRATPFRPNDESMNLLPGASLRLPATASPATSSTRPVAWASWSWMANRNAARAMPILTRALRCARGLASIALRGRHDTRRTHRHCRLRSTPVRALADIVATTLSKPIRSGNRNTTSQCAGGSKSRRPISSHASTIFGVARSAVMCVTSREEMQ